jgi:putative flippase GtrA
LIKHEFVRFLCVGIANTSFSYTLYILFNLVMPYTVAYTLSYILGVVFSYWLNSKWVFRVQMSFKTFVKFPLVYVAQYAINVVSLRLLVEQVGLSKIVAPFLVIVISIPITFLLGRTVMKPRQT